MSAFWFVQTAMQKSMLACTKLQRYSATSSGKSGEMKPGMSMPGGKPKRLVRTVTRSQAHRTA
jgi:hypothetical protein